MVYRSHCQAISAVLVPGSYQVTEGDEDGLELRGAPQQTPRLLNSQMLLSLDSHLAYLDEERTDVGGAGPIRQHPYRVQRKTRYD